MKRRSLLILVGLCTVLASCASSDGTMNKGLLGAASGGLLGALVGDNLLKKNNNGSTAAAGGAGGSSNGIFDDNAGLVTGAISGYAAGAITDSFAKNEVRQKYLDGYNKGRSDAIKELYWIKRDAQRPSDDSAIQRRYYEVPVPEHVTTDGVLVEPKKVVIEVVE